MHFYFPEVGGMSPVQQRFPFGPEERPTWFIRFTRHWPDGRPYTWDDKRPFLERSHAAIVADLTVAVQTDHKNGPLTYEVLMKPPRMVLAPVQEGQGDTAAGPAGEDMPGPPLTQD